MADLYMESGNAQMELEAIAAEIVKTAGQNVAKWFVAEGWRLIENQPDQAEQVVGRLQALRRQLDQAAGNAPQQAGMVLQEAGLFPHLTHHALEGKEVEHHLAVGLESALGKFIEVFRELLKAYPFNTQALSNPAAGLEPLVKKYAETYRRRKAIDARIEKTTKEAQLKRLRDAWDKR